MVADFPHKGATNLTPLFLHGAASADMTGWSAVLSALLDGLKDGLLSIPILFLAYLLMELLERSSRLNEGLLRRYSRRAGPALGGLLGIVPQCGISGAAATLFPPAPSPSAPCWPCSLPHRTRCCPSSSPR